MCFRGDVGGVEGEIHQHDPPTPKTPGPPSDRQRFVGGVAEVDVDAGLAPEVIRIGRVRVGAVVIVVAGPLWERRRRFSGVVYVRREPLEPQLDLSVDSDITATVA